MSTSMSIEEKLDAILKNNHEITSSNQELKSLNQELKAQNEYLRKQLGTFLKKKQNLNEEPSILLHKAESKCSVTTLNPQVKKSL